MIEVADFRNGMSLLGGAVSIITTADDSGYYGMTASAVCSVTDSPPTLLVCVNRNAWTHQHFMANGVLYVNVLAASQQALSGLFANKDIAMADRFTTHGWSRLATRPPALDDALVNYQPHP